MQDARGEKLAEELGTNAAFYHTDVGQEEEVRAAVGHAVQKWGRLDVMFNNAGFGGVSGSILTIPIWPPTMKPSLSSCAASSWA